jgi:hypothetical protein
LISSFGWVKKNWKEIYLFELEVQSSLQARGRYKQGKNKSQQKLSQENNFYTPIPCPFGRILDNKRRQ